MRMILRHLLSIVLLPGIVVVGVPCWLLTTFALSDSRWSNSSPDIWLARLVGALLFAVGLALFVWCVSFFARVGQGTLAPWDPTRNLVAGGPYRCMRNPMITGVVLMLIAQAFLWGSWLVGLWAFIFVIINHTYFVQLEEPGLERRFGENYRGYQAAVPRWLPRFSCLFRQKRL